jgi:hypothetical protein
MEKAKRTWAEFDTSGTVFNAAPDVSSGTAAWGTVATPVPGKTLRWTRAGARFFVELDREVISPLKDLLSVANVGRDLRRRAAGYQILLAGGHRHRDARASYVTEMDGLSALLEQEWTSFHRKERGDCPEVRTCSLRR